MQMRTCFDGVVAQQAFDWAPSSPISASRNDMGDEVSVDPVDDTRMDVWTYPNRSILTKALVRHL